MALATGKRVRACGPCVGAPAAARWGTRSASDTDIQGENGNFHGLIGGAGMYPPYPREVLRL